MYDSYHDGIHISWSLLWNLYERIRIFFRLSAVYEYAHLWWFAGKGTRWKKFYLIYGMCDETFSVNYTADIPEDVDKVWFMFFVTLLNQFYWVASATAGGIIGSLLKINTDGISFVMTAMFVVIFMDQWLKEDNHISSLIGLGVSLISLLIFGADSFMIPTMIAIVALLTVLRRRLDVPDPVILQNSTDKARPADNVTDIYKANAKHEQEES